ncbi:MAG: winged helix-turn-helix domain-containing protein [Fimbriimonas sp.]
MAYVSLDDEGKKVVDAIYRAFEGRSPDALMADLRPAVDFLPVRHVRWLIRETWGPDLEVPCLALLSPHHLHQGDMEAHIDDFLLDPIQPKEAIVRLNLMIGRVRRTQDGNLITFADVVLDIASSTARTHRGESLTLTHREFELLHFLCRHRGKFFDRDRLLTHVWGADFDGSDRTVDIHVCRLRSKLPPHAASLLETRRGLGYGFARAA